MFRAQTYDSARPQLMSSRIFMREMNRGLLYLLDVIRFPGLVEKSLCWAVQAQQGEPPLVWNRGDPVLAGSGRLRAEVDIGRAVGVLDGLVHRIERRKGLAIVEA